MSKNKSANTDVFEVKLAKNQMPKMTIDLTRNIVKYGPKNDFPAYLFFLQKNHPLHGGILKGKARYLTGTGIKSKSQNPQAEEFLKKANPTESWLELSRKYNADEVLSGGYFLKVVSNLIGTPLQWYHIPWAFCRISPCHKFVSYSEDWGDLNKYPITIFPVWKEGTVGTSVYVYKAYASNETKLKGTYAEPEYISATLDIDTDVRIGTYGNSFIKNNLSAGTIVTIYNGETDKEKKRQQAEALKFNHEGEDNAGKTVTLFATKDAKSTEVLSVNASDQDKMYVETGKRDQQNILTAHNVNGILFKIKTEGQLGGLTELAINQELLINEYAIPKQEIQLKIIEKFFTLRYNLVDEFEIEQVKFVDRELPLDNQIVVDALNAKDPNIITDYIINKYNLTIPEKLDAAGQPIQENSISVNDNLKGLSAAENSDVQRIVREFKKGRMPEAMATSRISAYGVTVDEAKKWLGISDPTIVQQAAQDRSKIFFELFDKYAHDINEEDEVIDSQVVHFHSISEAVKFERSWFKDYVKDPLSISVKDLNNAVLEQLKGNPSVTPADISKILKIEVSNIEESIKALKSAGLIAGESGNFTPTDKGINKTTDNVDTEVYTEYVYTKRPDVPGENIMPTTREFCVNMVNRTKRKALKYESIIQLENEFGENVWDFRGGFYTNPKTGETTPWCRHAWSAVTKIRRVKK